MTKLFDGVRPMDVVLTVLISGLGVVLMVGNMGGSEDDIRVDSTSWALIPVFLAATVPLLWRRRYTIAVILASAAAMAAHVAAFGWLVRCGAGLPLAFVLAYAAGRFVTDRVQAAVALALTIGVQALVLVRDSAAGMDIIPVTGAIAAVVWGVGLFVQSRSTTSSDSSAEAGVPVGASA